MTQAFNFGAETHLGGGDTSAFDVLSAVIARPLRLSLPVHLLGKAHKDSDDTVVIAVVHQYLHAETHRAGKVESAITISCLAFGRHC